MSKELILIDNKFVEEYKAKCKKSVDWAYAISVNNENAETVQETLQKIKNVIGDIEKERKKCKDPYFQAGKEIDKLAKEISEDGETAIKVVQAKLAQFSTDQDKIKQAEEKRIAEELQEKEKALEKEDHKEVEEKKQEALNTASEELLEVSVKTTTLKGGRKTIKFEIVDEAAVPMTLCSPDDKKINAFKKNEKEFILKQMEKSSDNTVTMNGIKYSLDLKY